jgi:hypothetical protein
MVNDIKEKAKTADQMYLITPVMEGKTTPAYVHEPHARGASMQTKTTRPLDIPRETIRALAGERVWIWVNTIKSDKREQFERFVHQILFPAIVQLEPAAACQVRFLHPNEANEDGTYTYVFLMDPVIEGLNYDISRLLKRAYGEVLGEEHNELLHEAEATPQTGYDLTQSTV